MTKCYFSNLQAITISELRMAQKNVCIAVAWINFEVYYPIFSELLSRGVSVQIIVNDDSNNARYKCQIDMQNFEDVLKYASEKGMLVSYQLPIKTENSDLNLFVDGMCRDEIELLFVKLNEFHKKYRETMDYFARFYYLTAKRYFLNNVIPTQCGAGTDFSIISPNGDIYSCYSHKDK